MTVLPSSARTTMWDASTDWTTPRLTPGMRRGKRGRRQQQGCHDRRQGEKPVSAILHGSILFNHGKTAVVRG